MSTKLMLEDIFAVQVCPIQRRDGYKEAVLSRQTHILQILRQLRLFLLLLLRVIIFRFVCRRAPLLLPH